MFQTKVSVFEKAVILDHPIFLSLDALKLRQGQLHFLKWNNVFFFDDIIIDFKTNSATYNTRSFYPAANFGRLPELDHRATVGPTLATKVW